MVKMNLIIILPKQSDPWNPSEQVQTPTVRSHWPLPLQGDPTPGHETSNKE